MTDYKNLNGQDLMCIFDFEVNCPFKGAFYGMHILWDVNK